MSVSLEVTTTIIVIDIALATTTHRIMHALFVFVEIIEIGVINLFTYRIIQGNQKNYLFLLLSKYPIICFIAWRIVNVPPKDRIITEMSHIISLILIVKPI